MQSYTNLNKITTTKASRSTWQCCQATVDIVVIEAIVSIPLLTETETLTSSSQWRIEMPCSLHLPMHPDFIFCFLLQQLTTASVTPISLCLRLLPHEITWEGSRFRLSFSRQSPEAILLLVMCAVYSKHINAERVVSPNCTKLDTALLPNLSNSPAKCDVDQMNGCQDVQVTHWQTEKDCLLYGLDACNAYLFKLISK